MLCFSGSSYSDKEIDALTPEKSAVMRGSAVGAGVALVPPSGATPTIAVPDRKRKRKGLFSLPLKTNWHYIPYTCSSSWTLNLQLVNNGGLTIIILFFSKIATKYYSYIISNNNIGFANDVKMLSWQKEVYYGMFKIMC